MSSDDMDQDEIAVERYEGDNERDARSFERAKSVRREIRVEARSGDEGGR